MGRIITEYPPPSPRMYFIMSYIAVPTVNENPNFTINRKVNRQKGKRSLTIECILPAPQTPMLHEDSLVRIAGSLLQLPWTGQFLHCVGGDPASPKMSHYFDEFHLKYRGDFQRIYVSRFFSSVASGPTGRCCEVPKKICGQRAKWPRPSG